MKLTSVPVQGRIGVTTDTDSADNSPHSNGIAWQFNDATVRMKDVSQSGSWGSNPTTNDILMIALDCDNKAWYFGVNGTWRNSGSPTSGSSKTGAVDYSGQSSLADNYLMVAFGGNFYTAGGTQTGQYNFGNPIYSANSYTDGAGYGNFSYQVPAGFYALNTKNLAQFG